MAMRNDLILKFSGSVKSEHALRCLADCKKP